MYRIDAEEETIPQIEECMKMPNRVENKTLFIDTPYFILFIGKQKKEPHVNVTLHLFLISLT